MADDDLSLPPVIPPIRRGIRPGRAFGPLMAAAVVGDIIEGDTHSAAVNTALSPAPFALIFAPFVMRRYLMDKYNEQMGAFLQKHGERLVSHLLWRTPASGGREELRALSEIKHEILQLSKQQQDLLKGRNASDLTGDDLASFTRINQRLDTVWSNLIGEAFGQVERAAGRAPIGVEPAGVNMAIIALDRFTSISRLDARSYGPYRGQTEAQQLAQIEQENALIHKALTTLDANPPPAPQAPPPAPAPTSEQNPPPARTASARPGM